MTGNLKPIFNNDIDNQRLESALSFDTKNVLRVDQEETSVIVVLHSKTPQGQNQKRSFTFSDETIAIEAHGYVSKELRHMSDGGFGIPDRPVRPVRTGVRPSDFDCL